MATPPPTDTMNGAPGAENGSSDASNGSRPRVPVGPLIAVIVVMLAIAALALWWGRHQEAKAIRSLPPDHRRALYENTRRQVQLECAPDAPPGLHHSCVQSARRLLDFPECDSACKELARPYSESPVR